VLGRLTCRVLGPGWTRRSCLGSWPGVAGCLTLLDARLGLRGPMPGHIALVWWGRCHASPDRVSECAPSDRHARGVVTGGLGMVCSQRFVPVLGAPLAGVGGVDGDHADPGLGGHREQSRTEFGGGHGGDDLAEPAAAAVFFTGCGVGEVKVLHRDGLDRVVGGPVQHTGQGVADLRVATLGPPDKS
jgi:hypothetical protein